MKSGKYNKISAIGVILITAPFLLKHWVDIPDFLQGFLAGIGICLSIGGLFYAKNKAGV